MGRVYNTEERLFKCPDCGENVIVVIQDTDYGISITAYHLDKNGKRILIKEAIL